MTLVKAEKANLVLAMEYMMRNCATDVPDGWLMCGVADGDIEYGETDARAVDDCYLDDKNFEELVECFNRQMRILRKDGLSS